MTELSPEERQLLRAGRTAFSPSSQRLDAVRDAVLASIAAAAPSVASAQGTGPASASTPAAWVGHIASKFGLATLVALAVATGYVVGHPERSTLVPAQTQLGVREADEASNSAPPSVSPEVPAAAPGREEAIVSERVRDERLARVATVRDKRTSVRTKRQVPASDLREPSAPPLPEAPSLAPASLPVGPAHVEVSVDTLAREAAFVRDARAATMRGDHEQALQILARHEQSFPNGVLREERFAIRARALCALGRTDAGKADIRRLRELAPGSPHLRQLEQVCTRNPAASPGNAD